MVKFTELVVACSL